MYPRVSDLFGDLLGIEFPVPLYSFGLMVAVAILTATWLTKLELDRKYARGLMKGVRARIRDKQGKMREVTTGPSVLVWTMMGLAAGLGVVGSKLFHILDYWDRFTADPMGLIISASGLTFYGGLIFGSLGVAYYAYRKGISVRHLADSVAPGLILAYGIGRIGCYLAGDGDWGICSDLADKPDWVPSFFWSETFPKNVIGPEMTPVDVIAYTEQRAQELGFSADVCTGADGVYPTMIYETLVCVFLFGILWVLRKNPFKAGWLFSLFLIFQAVERFTIEFIRLNPDVIGTLSQSQVISIGLFVMGAAGLFVTSRRSEAKAAVSAAHAASEAPKA